jgi:hypothetical protein
MEHDLETTSSATLDFIKHIVKQTSTPSWYSTVPESFGETKTGTLKADEWHAFSTLYLPLALVLLWGSDSLHPSEEITNKFNLILDHTMSLVQAIWLACYRTTSESHIASMHTHLQKYLSNLRTLFPDASPRCNQHMALHLADYMRLFGPVHSWWTYPFERVIGVLQQFPTNNKFGK